MRFEVNESNSKISGRTYFSDGTCYLGYSASSISFRFFGKKAAASIISNPDDVAPENRAWIAIYIDDSKEPAKRVELAGQSQEVVLYESGSARDVNIVIMKYTEPEYAVCGIKYLEIDDDAVLFPPPPPKKRRIQIIGDSITCGYGVEGNVDELVFKTSEENPSKSYSVLVAKDLDADFEIVAWNGKGVVSSYIEDDGPADGSWLVPMLYDYTDAGLCRFYFHEEKEKWQLWRHDRFEPDIITINLGTNDASYTRQIPERDEEFIKAYVDFLEKLHNIHQNAAILCMLGTMDQRLCPAVESAVGKFKDANKDVNISYLHLPMQLDEDGLGTFWHPSEATQKKTAELVAARISEMMDWRRQS